MTRGLLILVELLNFWVVQSIEVSRETWPLKVVVPCLIYVLILWDAPPPNNRGHQEAKSFLVGGSYQPSFATVTVWGEHPQIC